SLPALPVLLVQIYGDVDERTLQRSARILKDELQADPKISKIDSFGNKEREMRIEVDAERLKAYGISINQVAAIVADNKTQAGFGRLKSQGGKIIIRSDVKLEFHDQLMALPLITNKDGGKIFLRDVAKIVDGYASTDSKALYQGQETVGMILYTSSKGHLIEVSNAAHTVVENLKKQLPKEVCLDIWADLSIYMKNRLALLQSNAWQGLLIVFGILALFLNIKLAFWVALGIPFSIAGAVALMGESFLNYSLNDITTFGMILVLGLLVDDAIVVGESIYEERQTGADRISDRIEGTIKGVHKVAVATIFGALTTVAAFFPLMLIKNDFGRILAGFSMVVCVAILFSLVESKLILPAHLASISVQSKKPKNFILLGFYTLQQKAAKTLGFFNHKIYAPVLNHTLNHRYTALVVFITLAIVGGWFIRMGHVRTVFFPDIPGDVITVKLDMEKGTPAKMGYWNADVIEKAATALNTSLMAKYKTDLPPIRKIMSAVDDVGGIEIYAELQPQENRVVETLELLNMWRHATQDLEGVQSLQFSGNAETGGGFLLEVASRNDFSLKQAVEQLKKGLKDIDGVHDIRDDLKAGESEIKLTLKDEALHLGLTPADLAAQVGTAYGGFQIDKFQKGNDEVTLKVLYGRDKRKYIYQLLDTGISLSDGSLVPLTMVATLESKLSLGFIHRKNGKRVVEIKASLDKKNLSATKVFEQLQKKVIPKIEQAFPDVAITAGGELEEEGEVRGGLVKALILIVLLIYALLAVPLKSYWKPFVIISVIPFGFAGAVTGHLIAGVPLSVLSFFGMLALTGIVVNDSLVMLTRFNDILSEGQSPEQALRATGTSRFRAIFLTTATTVCGLMPLLSETSEQAQYLIPAAVSLAYGELFATVITLLLIPVLMNIAYDIQKIFKRFCPFSKERLE
ncbi:MAG: efflux RND transporter permease subunit, partial [Proteobacteria bacterium]|nr:efflux RND transporter permease subunit [Pseudomonadota bacterium]